MDQNLDIQGRFSTNGRWLRASGHTSWLALGLFLGFLLLYLSTLSAHYAPDGMAFTMLTTLGDLRQTTFFQAEHLLYPFGGWLWYRLWQWFGYEGGALVPLQVLNAIFGAMGVACFFGGLVAWLRQPKSWALCLLVATLLGVSLGYWQHSTDVEDQIIATSLILASFAALGRQRLSHHPDRSHFWALISSVTLALAILFHATSVLVLPVFLWGLWTARRKTSDLLRPAVALVIVVALPCLLVGWLVKGFGAVHEYLAWALAAPKVGVWGQGGLGSGWLGLKSLANAFFAWPGGPNLRALGQGEMDALPGVAAFLVVLLGLVFLAGAAATRIVRQRWPSEGTVALVWVVPLAAFALFWAPEDVQFWVGVWSPLLLLAAALSQDATQDGKTLVFFGALAAVVFLGNLLPTMVPRRDLSTNADYAKALCVREHTSPRDLVVTPGWDWVTTYVPYFAQRRVFSLVDTLVLSAGRDQEVLLTLLDQEVQGTQAQDGRVYVARLGTMTEEERQWFHRATGLEPEKLGVAGQEAWRCAQEPIWHWSDQRTSP